MDCKNYPRYFKVSDTIVRLEDNGDGTISGYVDATNEPYPPAKAIVDGSEINNHKHYSIQLLSIASPRRIVTCKWWEKVMFKWLKRRPNKLHNKSLKKS